jgi:hypothetical protein
LSSRGNSTSKPKAIDRGRGRPRPNDTLQSADTTNNKTEGYYPSIDYYNNKAYTTNHKGRNRVESIDNSINKNLNHQDSKNDRRYSIAANSEMHRRNATMTKKKRNNVEGGNYSS